MESLLLLVAVILLAGVWSVRVGNRLGFPVMLGFVVIGVVLGPNALGFTHVVTLLWAKNIGYVALFLILFEGGLHTSWSRVRAVWLPSLSLATIGVLISAVIMTLLTHELMQLTWVRSAFVGVAVSSTDAAAVFSILGEQSLPRRLVGVLEVESGTNDPMAFFLTIILIQWVTDHGFGGPVPAFFHIIFTFLLQMAVGLAVGVAVGFLSSVANQRVKLDTGGLYPTLSLAFAILAYAIATLLHGSGFLAVYVASIVMTSRRMEHRHSIVRFHEGLAWTMQILMFVVLGFQLNIGELAHIMVPGVGLAVAALLVARPVAVWLSTAGMAFSHQERAFLAWAGLRGAVPIVLVLTAVLAPGPAHRFLIDAVFFVVIVSTLIQGWTVRPLTERLGLLEPEAPEDLLELVAIARENAIVLPVEISDGSPLAGRKMVDVSFPQNTLCYAIIRDNRVIVPRGATRLHTHDHLLILSDRRHLDELRAAFDGEILGRAEFVP
ncbi:potassium/proton antiporter [Sulfobacillus harzensis]|uniref:Potassium/proton antiporter n=1 Tax=Sulfobacillus harzensis TaxID=2729629 RepID=A0A7Y0L5Y9_9FIRM|nr:potassium/proton antiporter [Sulfobacillus harzensis]NMP23830.1 potassium/proton antiporter [Sulfobacillus harzensis]